MEKEKQSGWVLLKRRNSFCNFVSQLGDTIRMNTDVFQKFEKNFCHLHGMPDETNTRYRKFYMENTPERHHLLPTKDDLTQHIRANYQVCTEERSRDQT